MAPKLQMCWCIVRSLHSVDTLGCAAPSVVKRLCIFASYLAGGLLGSSPLVKVRNTHRLVLAMRQGEHMSYHHIGFRNSRGLCYGAPNEGCISKLKPKRV